MSCVSNVEICIKRGDTRRHVFKVLDSSGNARDISLWSSFKLAANTLKKPPDNTTQVFELAGSFVNDGTDGLVYFTPLIATAVGKYYYDAQALDGNSEIITFVEGKYIVEQDRTKG